MRFKGLYSVLCFVLSGFCFGQTNPTAQSIPYNQDFSSLAWTSTTYPAGWQGWQLSAAGGSASYRTVAPLSDLALVASGDANAISGGVYNYNGKIGFLQSGSVDPAICLALVTTGLNGITVNYDIMTLRNPYDGSGNTRINEFCLQYRVGTSGAFTNITSGLYQNNTTTQTGAITTPQNSSSKSVLLPAACDNQAVVQIRWVGKQVSGAGSRPSCALDNVSVTSCTTNTSTYYYRSLSTGNWNYYGTWEASPDGISGWAMACSFPTSAAAAVTIQSGHTVTINTNVTAPNLTISGTLIFDNTARTMDVTNYVTVSASGTFITQSAGTATHALSMGGDLTNSGTFDMSRGGTTLVCNVTFNKNGNQNISGSGATTRFNYMTVNLGTSRSNILNISTSNFSAATSFLHSAVAASPNNLLNGTLKFSGTFSFTGTLFKTGANYNIPATAGIWLNNSSVTISAQNDSYNVSGLLKITDGTFNAGTAAGNAIRLLSGSQMFVDGGTVNVSGRIQAANSTPTDQGNLSYNQSGGIVNLTTAGTNTHGTLADFHLFLSTDTLNMSGGTIVFRNVATTASDVKHNGYSIITGGTMQFGDASTTFVGTSGYEIEAGGTNSFLPSLVINNASGLNPVLYPGTDIKVIGNITINAGTTLDCYWGGTFYYDISLTGNWSNSGAFIHNDQKTITFNGTAAQTILGSTTTSFNNLTIDNSLGGVTLSAPVIIAGAAGVLTLTNGYLYSSSTNTLTMNAGTSTTGVNNNSFVYGPMSKIGTTAFTFPVGKDVLYRPIGISALTGSETFTAEYFHSDPDAVPYDVTLKDATLENIGRCEFWILNRAGSANANVTLSWDTYSCGVTSLPDLAVGRWDGAMWKDEGNTATTGAPDPGTGTVTSGVITSFSPFTLANRTVSVNPLPIELLSFTAAYTANNKVDVKWTTASEINNDYFTVERSEDAVSFNPITMIDGAGNSTSVLNYSTTDNEPLDGISYYRLKQTDFDGHFKYSSTVTVQKNQTDFEIVNAHYTFANEFGIYFNCTNNCMVTIELYDATGKKVFSSFENTLGKNSEILIPTKNLSEGIYLVKAYNGNKLVSKKVKL